MSLVWEESCEVVVAECALVRHVSVEQSSLNLFLGLYLVLFHQELFVQLFNCCSFLFSHVIKFMSVNVLSVYTKCDIVLS